MVRHAGPAPRWGRALVTGGSAGIGAAFAESLASDGTHLVLVARRQVRLRQVADRLRTDHRVDVEILPADLTEDEARRRVERRLGDDDAAVDLLVNNAGGALALGSFTTRDPDSVTAEIRLNIETTARLMHVAATTMTARGHGNIINVSAGVAFYPAPGSANYAAAKSYINSLSQAVNWELKDAGVRVTTVCPGFTVTSAQDRLGIDRGAVAPFLWSRPEEVATVALHAAFAGKTLVSVGIFDRFGASLGRHLPRRTVMRAVERTLSRLHGDENIMSRS